MATISHIRLELAREPGHPEGDAGHGYEVFLPLTDDGRIDAEAWRHNRGLCHVVKFHPREDDRRGRIVHGPGGRWSFDYDAGSARDDEQGFRLGAERFAPGEYVSIRENDGVMHTFRVVSVRPA